MDMTSFPPLPSPKQHHQQRQPEINSVSEVSSKQSTTLPTNKTTYLSENVPLIESSHLLTGTHISSNENLVIVQIPLFLHTTTLIIEENPFF